MELAHLELVDISNERENDSDLAALEDGDQVEITQEKPAMRPYPPPRNHAALK